MSDFNCRICGNTGFLEFNTSETTFYCCKGCSTIFKFIDNFNLPKIKFKKLSDKAIIPTKAHSNDVAFDLYSIESGIIPAGEVKLFKTNIALELPENHEAQVRARSGNAKRGIIIANGPGTIDTNYRGDVGVLLYNSTKSPYEVNINDRIAQLLIMPKLPFELMEVEELSETDRGSGGFGSTGK